MLPVGYRPSQPKVNCSQGISADDYIENGAPLPQVAFSYEWGRGSIGEFLSEVLISDGSPFWDHGSVALIIVRGRRGS